MKTYLDANILVQLYLHMPSEPLIMQAMRHAPAAESWPCPVTDLLKIEVTNAIERMVFESRNGAAFRTTPEAALLAQGDFQFDIQNGIRFRAVPLTLTDIETEFDTLARRYTAMHGFRTYDVIHVASALKLRCKRFLSFDAKANALAKLVGLKTL